MNSTKFFSLLSLQVIVIFMTVIFVSFIPDHLHDFFGDWFCGGKSLTVQLCFNNGFHSPQWHWGYRHWIWFIMGFILFVLQCIRVVLFIDKTEIKK